MAYTIDRTFSKETPAQRSLMQTASPRNHQPEGFQSNMYYQSILITQARPSCGPEQKPHAYVNDH